MSDDWVDVSVEQDLVILGKEGEAGSDAAPQVQIPEVDLDLLYSSLIESADSLIALNQPIFVAEDASANLYDLFLEKLAPQYRQKMQCSCCKAFVRRFGSLAIVDVETGKLKPLFWSKDLPKENVFHASCAAIRSWVESAKVGRQLKVRENKRACGPKTAGGFTHMHYEFSEKLVQKEEPRGFASASTTELARMLRAVLEEYDEDTVDRAYQLLVNDKLPYADSHKAAIRWIQDLHKKRIGQKLPESREGHNLVSHYAASAFIGAISQLRSGALSTLLDDIKAGKTFEAVQDSWQNIAGPTRYMRPTALPSAGQIAAAEALFASLGVTANDMRRKYLGPDEIPKHAYLWKHRDPASSGTGGVFGGITPKNAPASKKMSIESPVATPTSFARLVCDILPRARKVEYDVLDVAWIFFFITGLPGTKPLMQWHDDDNLSSWYTRSSPIRMPDKGLRKGWAEVRAIVGFPHMWSDMRVGDMKENVPSSDEECKKWFLHLHHGLQYLIQLCDAREDTMDSLCLFPTLLKSEFHGVRQTIEAYSAKGSVEDTPGHHHVGGVMVGKSDFGSGSREHIFRITGEKGQREMYKVVMFA